MYIMCCTVAVFTSAVNKHTDKATVLV